VPRLRDFLSENSLSLFFLVIFLLAVFGQAVAGHDLYNDEAAMHGDPRISLWQYLSTADFARAVTENWQSEYLQFALFAAATIWLLQKGSPESKELDKAGREGEREQKLGEYAEEDSPAPAKERGGLRRWVFSNSLLLVMTAIFLASWFAQSVNGLAEYNDQQDTHGEPSISWLDYIGTADFWEATFQNWQSEFLAVGSFAVLAVFLRQRGSPESKPVGASTLDSTGQEG
jgi:hypothetical protein